MYTPEEMLPHDPGALHPSGPGGETGDTVSWSAPTAEQVFLAFGPRIYSLARRMVGNDTDAEDVTQDVLVQVVTKRDTFRGQADFVTWLHRVTVNAALAFRRKQAGRKEHEISAPPEHFLLDGRRDGPRRRWAIRPDQHALERELGRLLEKAIAALPPLYRDPFVLVDIERLSPALVAELLAVSRPALKSRLHRARLLLRNALAPYFEEQT
jgi:RNA polymerase sigma-70 factor (ECF subfamily)